MMAVQACAYSPGTPRLRGGAFRQLVWRQRNPLSCPSWRGTATPSF